MSPAERGSFCPDGPGVRFRPGRAEELGVSDNSLGGVLAWYSLIHTGPMLETFDHAVTTAWYWPVDMLRVKVGQPGSLSRTWRAGRNPDRVHTGRSRQCCPDAVLT
ncbi:hypothetical protein [Corynebacterium neomassiliense]|uniref:hypothetical protein n=1 Tax=Corynebacterium neomassiliense TaxID=2079482 RepID=UPI001F4413FC|nr:hypothetical protein [Corynebacterium neomassiliense]